MGILDRIFKPAKKRRFAVWQIEITTRCSLQCTMCVKEACAGWSQNDMTYDEFNRIVPYLEEVENVVLEGWGESLLHPDLPRFIKLVKGKGTSAGFVTSGTGLNEPLARRLIDAGVDFMGLSFSGATAATHNRIRKNSDFHALVETAAFMANLGRHTNPPRPRLHIAYLMVRENMEEIPALITLAARLGIGEVVLINMIQISTTTQASDKAFAYNDGEPYGEIMRKAGQIARALKISLIKASLAPRHVTVCQENPLVNVYISSDGMICPCVYLYPPVPSPFRRIFRNDEFNVEKVFFGNIFREPFETIWQEERYRAFRLSFENRARKADELYQSFLEHTQREETDLPDPPEPCRTCHKMLGL